MGDDAGDRPGRDLARWRAPRAVHDPGKIIADLAAAVALGGDCLADIAVLREQPELVGPRRAQKARPKFPHATATKQTITGKPQVTVFAPGFC